MWEWTKDFGGWIWEKLLDFGGWIWDELPGWLESLWEWTKDFGGWIWKKLKEFGEWLWKWIKDLFSEVIVNAVKDWYEKSALKKIIDTIFHWVEGIYDKYIGLVDKVAHPVKTIKSAFGVEESIAITPKSQSAKGLDVT